jgi:stage II sporulation protein D
MKSLITAAAVFAALLLAVPAVPVLISGVRTENAVSSDTEETTEAAESTSGTEEIYKVLDITTGKVEEISAFDYTVGAVCAEMPATFEPEALKAQAVAARTYAQRLKLAALSSPDESLGGAYFSNDSSKYQAYFTENQAKQYYGENYDKYMEKIKEAVKETENEILVYEGEPIVAAFHSVSAGETESALNVWGGSYDYLVPVDSSDDLSAPRYLEEYSFTDEQMKDLLETAFPDIELDDDPALWFSDSETSSSGTVLQINAGNITVSGQEIRSALSLRSAVFEIEYEDEFTVTTKGSGHCVGMSQYGANAMAQKGSDYREILAHYYPGTEISEINV